MWVMWRRWRGCGLARALGEGTGGAGLGEGLVELILCGYIGGERGGWGEGR